jgi:hypothetical protein
MVTLGIIADTHIPDRAQCLHPGALECFQRSGVHVILHAGDVSVPRVLAELEIIAPVYAVRGNRDWVYLRHLPWVHKLNIEGVLIGLIHGHGDLAHYLTDKAHYLLYGLQEQRYIARVLSVLTSVRVIVFGHLHIPVNRWVDGRLVFNPGSACCPDKKGVAPSVGLLHIHAGGQVEGEIIPLDALKK